MAAVDSFRPMAVPTRSIWYNPRMSPALGMAIYWLYPIAVLIASGIVLAPSFRWALRGWRTGQPVAKWVGSIVTLAIAAAGIYLAFNPFQPSRSEQVKDIMKLPAGAQVIGVDPGDWGGDGTVTFRLPSSRPVQFWMKAIWYLNPSDQPLALVKKSNVWIGTSTVGSEYRELDYDPVTGVYKYVVTLES
jgi:hypothetical protein